MMIPDNASQGRILVVDDDEHFRSFITRFLAKNNFEPVAAASGDEGLALAGRTVPDLVLCDLEMPGRNGYDVLAAFHRDPALAGIPVIFLTGQAAPSQVRFGMNLGADDYLTKPINSDDLCGAIKARLARNRARRGPAAAPVRSAPAQNTFLVKTLAEQRLVKTSEITHILAYGEYSWVHWGGDKRAMLRKSLKQWLTELPAEQFIRVHRGAIVNLGFLESVEKSSGGGLLVRLQHGAEPIPVSLRLAPALNRKLQSIQRAPGASPVAVASPACAVPHSIDQAHSASAGICARC